MTARAALATLSRTRTSARILKFLQLYSQSGNVTQACAAACITRETHYRKLREDEAYRAAFAEAEAAAGQHLEDLAVQRVEDGTYDYQMHLALLKRFRPELYRERTSVDTNITVNLADRLEAARKRLNEGQE